VFASVAHHARPHARSLASRLLCRASIGVRMEWVGATAAQEAAGCNIGCAVTSGQ